MTHFFPTNVVLVETVGRYWEVALCKALGWVPWGRERQRKFILGLYQQQHLSVYHCI